MKKNIKLLPILIGAMLTFSACSSDSNAEISNEENTKIISENSNEIQPETSASNESLSEISSEVKLTEEPSINSNPTEKEEVSPSKEDTEISSADSDKLTCTLSISCEEILENTENLDSSKSFSIPEDGFILKETEMEFTKGDSAFDLLLNTVKENKIHMEFSKTPGTNSVYIEGIANIYEFDCGEFSGWVFLVNDEMPMVSSSEYEVSSGDYLEFRYVCSYFE